VIVGGFLLWLFIQYGCFMMQNSDWVSADTALPELGVDVANVVIYVGFIILFIGSLAWWGRK